MELRTPRGMRDLGPEEKLLRDKVVKELVKVFEIYGFSPLQTPLVESFDVLGAKFAAGQESDVMKEVFKLKDQGGRNLGLRFDLTVPFARFVGMNPQLKMPFKRYQLGEVYRDGPIKLGRLREFVQCDVDVVGSKRMIADAEIIKLALEFFSRMKFDAFIEVNNRKLLQGLLLDCGVNKRDLESVIVSVDKLKKVGVQGVRKELKEKKVREEVVKKIVKVFSLENLKDVEVNNSLGVEGLEELRELFSYFSKKELKNVILNLSLARGLGYYTGTVFEGFLRNSKIRSSICGGGRYDDLIGTYVGKGSYPTVGISFGLDVIIEAMKLEGFESKKTVAEVYVIPIKTLKESFKIINSLRVKGVKADMDLIGRGISKNLDYANKLGIRYVVFVGAQELNKGKLKLRDMVTGKEKFVNLSSLAKFLKN